MIWYTHARTNARTHVRMHARTHTPTHTHELIVSPTLVGRMVRALRSQNSMWKDGLMVQVSTFTKVYVKNRVITYK